MVVDGPLVEGVDVSTAVHLDGHPSLVLEHDQRLANRDSAHAQVFGDGVLGHPHAGAEHPVKDECPDVEGYVVSAAGADKSLSTADGRTYRRLSVRASGGGRHFLHHIRYQVALRASPRVASWRKGTPLSARGSPGRPRTRSAMMLRWICSVPPPILLIHCPKNWRVHRLLELSS